MPSRRPARRLVVAALGCAALLHGMPPSDPPKLEARRLAGRCVATRAGAGEPCGCEVPGSIRRLLGLPIALETASAADLEQIPGIGPSRARGLLEAREAGRQGWLDARARQLRGALLVRGRDPACEAGRLWPSSAFAGAGR